MSTLKVSTVNLNSSENTKIGIATNDMNIVLTANNSDRVIVRHDGTIDIYGTINAASVLKVANIHFNAAGTTHLRANGANTLTLETAGVERLRVDADGGVGIGTSSPQGMLHIANTTFASLQVQGGGTTNIILNRNSNDASEPVFQFRKSRGDTTTQTAVATGDALGSVSFRGYGGTNLRNLGFITGAVETFTSDSDIASYIVFGTSSPGSGAINAEKMRLDSSGNVLIGRTNSTVGQGVKLDVNGAVNASAIFATNVTTTGLLDMETFVETDTSPTISAGTLTIDLNAGTVFDVSLNASVTTFTISNTPATAGKTTSFTLILTADGTARTVAWPGTFKWPSGTAPTITSTLNKRDVFVFFTTDNGTSWNAFISGQNL